MENIVPFTSTARYNQGGLRAGVPTSYNEFKTAVHFSMVIQKHSTGAMAFLMLDVRCRQSHGKS